MQVSPVWSVEIGRVRVSITVIFDVRRFRDSERMREFCGLEDPEDRVFGCFVLGRVEEGKQWRGARRDWREKVTWK